VEYIIGVNSVVGRRSNPADPSPAPLRCEDATNFNAEVRIDRYVDWINGYVAERQGGSSFALGNCAAGGDASGQGFWLALVSVLMARRRRKTTAPPAKRRSR
jgi:hypothetical protein